MIQTETIIFDDKQSLGEPASLATDESNASTYHQTVVTMELENRHNNAAYFLTKANVLSIWLECPSLNDREGELDPAEVKNVCPDSRDGRDSHAT
jgi:hypothetical protein